MISDISKSREWSTSMSKKTGKDSFMQTRVCGVIYNMRHVLLVDPHFNSASMLQNNILQTHIQVHCQNNKYSFSKGLSTVKILNEYTGILSSDVTIYITYFYSKHTQLGLG